MHVFAALLDSNYDAIGVRYKLGEITISGPDTITIPPFLSASHGGDTYHASLDRSGTAILLRHSLEAVGSPVFPYNPYLPLICA